MDMTIDEEGFIIARGWYAEVDIFWAYCKYFLYSPMAVNISGYQQVWLRAQGKKPNDVFPTVYVIVKAGTRNAFKATIAKGEVTCSSL